MTRCDVHAVVLAAGSARRMGMTKQLASTRGVPMVRRTVDAVLRAKLDGVVVVLPPEADAMATALSGIGCAIVVNPDPHTGLMSSIKVGLGALPPAPTGGVMIALGDQPLVTEADYARIARVFRAERGRCIVRPSFAGIPGNPVTIPRSLIPEILSHPTGDYGAAFLLRRHPDLVREVAMESDGVVFDVDTPQDLKILTTRLSAATLDPA